MAGKVRGLARQFFGNHHLISSHDSAAAKSLVVAGHFYILSPNI
jgi:hypothetical protein